MSWVLQRVATPLCTLERVQGRVAEHPRPGIPISTLILLHCLIPLLPLQSEQLRLEEMGEKE